MASGVGFVVGWTLWWGSRLWSESAHIVDFGLEALVFQALHLMGASAALRLGGAGALAATAGLIAATVGAALAPLTYFWARARGGPWKHPEREARRLGRHAGLQVAISGAAWLAIEAKSLAFEASLVASPAVVKLLLFGILTAPLVGFVVSLTVQALFRPVLGGLGPNRSRRFERLAGALPIGALLLLLIGALSPPAGRGAERIETASAAPIDSPERVLLIGVDGACFPVIDRLIDVGLVPNLAGLLERGAGGRLRAVMPPFSPPVWTTIATGVRPWRHGIDRFAIPIPGDYRSELVGSVHRRVPALWDVASTAGLPVLCAGWYASFPATPLSGAMVSDRAAAELEGRCAPETLCDDVDGILRRIRSDADWFEPILGPSEPATEEERSALDLLREELVEDRLILDVADTLLSKEEWRLACVYVRATDSAQHLLWKYRTAVANPTLAGRLWDVDPGTLERRAAVVDSIYAWTDRRIGRLIDLAGEETAVFVVSDHGAGARLGTTRSYDLNPLLRRLGLQEVDREGEIDLSRSILYERRDEVPFWSPCRFLHLSIAGRDREGLLDPSRAEQARDEAVALLSQLRRSDRRPLFSDIDILDFHAADPLAADLSLRFNGGLDTGMAVIIPRGERLDAADFAPESKVSSFSGNHRMGGIIAAAGPGLREDGATILGVSALDVAPTVATLLGLPVPDDTEGRVLRELLDPEWLDENPPRSIASWGERETGGGVYRGRADEEFRKRLEALGYLR